MPNSAASNDLIHLEDFIAAAINRLKEAGIENANLDACILVAYGLKCDRTQLLSQRDRTLTALEAQKLRVFIECRARHESVSRIVGQREFWSLPFGLNHATLEPRPDSETVVETVLKMVRPNSLSPQRGERVRVREDYPSTKYPPPSSQPFSPPWGEKGLALQPEPHLRILDLGAGTGCLLLSLLHELPKASGIGVDVSAQAVEQAKENAKNLGLDDRAVFQTGDWFEGIDERFDIILSNPPYIVHKDIATLMPEVRDHDPHLALDGGNDGLACYRLLAPRLQEFLKPGGFVVFEVGQGQAESVGKMFAGAGLGNVATAKDLGGIERVITGALE